MKNEEWLSAAPMGNLTVLNALAQQTAPIACLRVVMGPDDASGQGRKQYGEWRESHD